MDITQYLPFIDECFYPKKYTLKEIIGGLSDDIKIKAELEGKSYIVKIVEGKCKAPPYNANRTVWYQILCMANALDKRIVCPVRFGYIADRVVTVTEWLEGISLEEYLYKNPDKKIACGKTVGKLLYALHNFGFVKSGIKERNEKFAPKIIKKVDGLIESARRLNITFAGVEKVIRYLQVNKSVINEDRVGILHNDIRLENFIINDGGIYIFDFDSGTLSDCYGDFTYMTALADNDFRVFSYAVIMSYFNGKIPADFWEANLYFCMIKLLEYAVYKYKKSGRAIVRQATSCMKIFNGYKEAIPDWWRETDGQYGKEFSEENG